jgi:hypothetical protein
METTLTDSDRQNPNCTQIPNKWDGQSNSSVRGLTGKQVALHEFRSQSVHGRTRACHARRRGSLPLGTAKVLFQSSTAAVQLTVNQLVGGSIPPSGARYAPFVYRLGHPPFTQVRGVRFSYGVPVLMRV